MGIFNLDLFGKNAKRLSKKLEKMEHHLKHAFSKVRSEMDQTTNWLVYYYDKSKYYEKELNKLNELNSQNSNEMAKNEQYHQDQDIRINDLSNNMSSVLNEISTLQEVAKEKVHTSELNFHIENITQSLHQVEKKVEQYSYLPSKVDVIKEQVEKHIATPHVSTDIDKRIEELQERLKSIIFKKTPKEKLVQKVSKNSHDYIKAMVLSYIRKYGKISAYQLREMVVEEQNITSKSTLYRILEEIEESEEISTLRQGKEKIFLANLSKPA